MSLKIYSFEEGTLPDRERVWLVWDHHVYDGDYIIKIFKTKEEAVQYAQDLVDSAIYTPQRFYEVEEWIIDKLEGD